MGRARTSLDVNSLARAIARPGIDTRSWIDKCVVEDVGVDPNKGVFVDVKSLINGDVYCAYLCGPSVADGAGDYCPVAEGDTVIVARPGGVQGNGAYIIGRAWDQSDKPSSEFHENSGPATGRDPSPDRTIIMKPGTSINILSADGGHVKLQASDSGNIYVLVPDTGKVILGEEAGSEPPALGTTLKSYLNSLRTWLAAHTHTGVTVGGGTTAVPATLPVPSVPDIEADKVTVK